MNIHFFEPPPQGFVVNKIELISKIEVVTEELLPLIRSKCDVSARYMCGQSGRSTGRIGWAFTGRFTERMGCSATSGSWTLRTAEEK
jgi:hypothetical protein